MYFWRFRNPGGIPLRCSRRPLMASVGLLLEWGWVKLPDRFACSTTVLLSFGEHLRTRSVAVGFVDNASLNADTPQAEFRLTSLAAVAWLEWATIR